MDDKEISELLDRILAPWVRELALTPVKADAEGAHAAPAFRRRAAPFRRRDLRQVFMAAADTAMIVAISAALRRL